MRDTVLHPAAMRAGAFGDPHFLVGDGWSGGNLAVIFFNFSRGDFRRDVAGDHQRDVVRAVIGLEPLLNVAQRGGVQILHGADDGPRVRMADRIGVFGDEFVADGVRLIFALAFFVLHDAALQVELLLIEHAEQMAHAVAFGEQNVVEHGGGNVFEIIGAVVVGGAVQVGGADVFHAR